MYFKTPPSKPSPSVRRGRSWPVRHPRLNEVKGELAFDEDGARGLWLNAVFGKGLSVLRHGFVLDFVARLLQVPDSRAQPKASKQLQGIHRRDGVPGLQVFKDGLVLGFAHSSVMPKRLVPVLFRPNLMVGEEAGEELDKYCGRVEAVAGPLLHRHDLYHQLAELTFIHG